ncbi:unnamed protein product [Mesocestoides corti]|nr:unnamed protein product [Mesocestoides corti]
MSSNRPEGVTEEMDVSSGPESEIASDPNDSDTTLNKPNLSSATTRKPPSKLKSGLIKRKEKRRDARGKELRPSYPVCSQSSSSPQSAEPVFEECVLRGTPHIELNLSSTVKDLSETDDGHLVSGFGVFSRAIGSAESAPALLLETPSTDAVPVHHVPILPSETPSHPLEINDEPPKPPPLTPDALWAGKASQADLANNPVFSKNPGRGTPSSRLYVKNLHKKTTEEDLWLVFGSFSQLAQQGASNQFSIQLLTGGRMKGQAFIGFDSIELATQALEAAHGYLLNGKPMHVQFARGAIAKPDPKSFIISGD